MSAAFSPCRNYRYLLSRRLCDPASNNISHCVFIGLNPSTADETVDDPTIRRCMGFARSWGFGWLVMLNLFAFRSTDPRALKAAHDPVGQDSDAFLRTYTKNAGIVVAAWGAHGKLYGRDAKVRAMIPNLHYLRLTRAGAPGHPLYLPANLSPQRWEG